MMQSFGWAKSRGRAARQLILQGPLNKGTGHLKKGKLRSNSVSI